MSKIYDLDLLVEESITFKIGGEDIEIPSSPSTALVIKIMKLEEKMKSVETPEEQMSLLAEIVALLLSQGERKVTKKFIQDKFSMSQQRKVVDVFKSTMQGIEEDPN
ncbi:hypothetical protein [Radiobacillus sp. PE A8.2]|uniref:hypothetical protein n=1 Tax=Radiobacillus sp. PE A8.2 TaxID=3380349 RepID=UPI00388D701C